MLPLIVLALPLLMSAAVKSRQKRSFAFGNDESPKPCRIQSEGDQLRVLCRRDTKFEAVTALETTYGPSIEIVLL